MLKYIQTQIPIPLFKRLKVEALERDTTLGELLQEILTTFITTLDANKEAKEHGTEKIEKRLIRSRTR